MRVKVKHEDWYSISKNLKEDRPVTTFQASRILGVAHTTIIAWINQGKLAAFRTPGGHRRLYKQHLATFIELYQVEIPRKLKPFFSRSISATQQAIGGTTEKIQAQRKLVLFGPSANRLLALEETLKTHFAGHEILRAETPFQIGKIFAYEPADIVLIDSTEPIPSFWETVVEMAREKDYSQSQWVLFGDPQLLQKNESVANAIDLCATHLEESASWLFKLKKLMKNTPVR